MLNLGHAAIVQLLAKGGTNLNLPDDRGSTPLLTAVQNGIFHTQFSAQMGLNKIIANNAPNGKRIDHFR